MDILDQIASRGMLQKEKDELKRICNRLLSSSFLCQKNDASRSDYYFVLKFRTEFQTLLETLGFRLEINGAVFKAMPVNQFHSRQFLHRTGSPFCIIPAFHKPD